MTYLWTVLFDVTKIKWDINKVERVKQILSLIKQKWDNIIASK